MKRGTRKTLPDLEGRDILPEARPLSRAQKARAETGYNCNHSRGEGHDHHH